MPFECEECRVLGARIVFGLDQRLCKNCKILYKFRQISKSNAKKKFGIKDNDLENLEFKEVGNPLYRGACNMILYKEKDVLQVFYNKYYDWIEWTDRDYFQKISNLIEVENLDMENYNSKISDILIKYKDTKKQKK